MDLTVSAVEARDLPGPVGIGQRARAAVAALQHSHLDAHYVAGRRPACAAVLARVPHAASIFCSQEPILDELGVSTELRGRDIVGHEARFRAAVYLTSVDALTCDGRILCRAGSAHRLAPVLFGPAKVVIVLGTEDLLDGSAMPEGLRDYSFLLKGSAARPPGRISFLLVGPR